MKNVSKLGLAQDWKTIDLLLSIGCQSPQQSFEVRQPTGDCFEVKESGIVVAIDQKTLVRFDDIDEQVEIYRRLGIRIDLNLQSWEIEICSDFFEVELHLDQRQPARVATEL